MQISLIRDFYAISCCYKYIESVVTYNQIEVQIGLLKLIVGTIRMNLENKVSG